MKFGRIVAAVAVAASALVISPTANATEQDVQQDEWVIESVTRPDDVWDQSNWAWDPDYPVVAHPAHGEDNQTWHIDNDNHTVVNKKYGTCVTNINGKLAGRRCDGSANQRWLGHSTDNYHSWHFELGSTDRCITHNGEYKELVLADCENDRTDQRWIIHKR